MPEVEPKWNDEFEQIIPATDTRPAMKIMGCNCTDDESLYGYYIAYVGKQDEYEGMINSGQWDKSDIKDIEPPPGMTPEEEEQWQEYSKSLGFVDVKSSAVASYLAKSYQEKLHSNGMEIYPDVDEGHKSVGMSGDQKSFGKIVDIKAIDGKLVNIQTLPEGSVATMVKIAWYEHEIENVRLNKYGQRISVVFDFEGVFLNIGLCQVPVVREVPPVWVKSQGIIKTKGQKFRDPKSTVKFKEEKMPEEEKVQSMAEAIAKVKQKADDPTLKEGWAEVGLAIGMSEEGISAVGDAVSNEDLQALIDAYGSTTEEPTEPTAETHEFKDSEVVKKSLEEVKTLTEDLKKQSEEIDKLMKTFKEKPVIEQPGKPQEDKPDVTKEIEALAVKYYKDGSAKTMKEAIEKANKEVDNGRISD